VTPTIKISFFVYINYFSHFGTILDLSKKMDRLFLPKVVYLFWLV